MIEHDVHDNAGNSTPVCTKTDFGRFQGLVSISKGIHAPMQANAHFNAPREMRQVTATDEIAAELPGDQSGISIAKERMGEKVHV